MLIAIMTAAALLGAGIDPDGVVTTAPRGHQAVSADATAPEPAAVPSASTQTITAHGLTTDQQIDRWISQRSAEQPFAQDRGARPADDRKMHGEVSAAIGTGDYTAYSATVSIPVGESGRVDLTYSESKNSPYGYGYGYGYGGYGSPYDRYGYDRYGYGGYGSGHARGRSREMSVGASFGGETGSSRETPVWDRLSPRRDADTSRD